MNEPETREQPRPFQFTIGSLMILTAAVAGFFALATQAPLEVTLLVLAAFPHIFLLILSLRNQKYRKGITAINYSLINCCAFPAIMFNSNYFLGIDVKLGLVLLITSASILGSSLFSIVVQRNGTRFNMIAGDVGIRLSFVAFGLLLFIWYLASIM